ncbi:MAG TPA: DUF2282 domain-containing protein [Bauldia sp.]|nr:DUF2282 domain-containing protein [Bauldia sp.]
MSAVSKPLTVAALAGAVTAAMASFASAAGPDDTKRMMAGGDYEMCYGVALKGQNDCAAGAHSCAGTATVDYDGQSFKLVAKGTCTTMETPFGPGSLTPIERPA